MFPVNESHYPKGFVHQETPVESLKKKFYARLDRIRDMWLAGNVYSEEWKNIRVEVLQLFLSVKECGVQKIDDELSPLIVAVGKKLVYREK